MDIMFWKKRLQPFPPWKCILHTTSAMQKAELNAELLIIITIHFICHYYFQIIQLFHSSMADKSHLSIVNDDT